MAMCSKDFLLAFCLGLIFNGLRLTSTSTTTTFVAAMSISNPDFERYLRSANTSQPYTSVTIEERLLLDTYAYAFLSYSYDGQSFLDKEERENARYGEGKELSVSGKLVHITQANDPSNHTACSSDLGETPPLGVEWIALVKRGDCTFEEKVRNVYQRRASGVIVYNDKEVTSLDKMQIKDKERNITAVITYQKVGEEMAEALETGHDVYVSIKKGKSGSRPINTLNRTSVLFVSISFIVLMVFSLVWLIFYYIQRFRYLQTKDHHSRQLCSVTKKAIMKIPTRTGKSSDEKDIDNDCCAICIETYKNSDCIRVLPCRHEFHKNCIDPWLMEHRTCPMCKLDVLKYYGFVVGDQIRTSPSPQHQLGPNLAPIDANDVPVVVVAVPQQQQQHQQQSQQQQQQQQHQQQQQQQMSNGNQQRQQTTATLQDNCSVGAGVCGAGAAATINVITDNGDDCCAGVDRTQESGIDDNDEDAASVSMAASNQHQHQAIQSNNFNKNRAIDLDSIHNCCNNCDYRQSQQQDQQQQQQQQQFNNKNNSRNIENSKKQSGKKMSSHNKSGRQSKDAVDETQEQETKQQMAQSENCPECCKIRQEQQQQQQQQSLVVTQINAENAEGKRNQRTGQALIVQVATASQKVTDV